MGGFVLERWLCGFGGFGAGFEAVEMGEGLEMVLGCVCVPVCFVEDD